MSQDLVLQVRDLNVWYRPSGTIGRRKRRQVLHDVSFDLHRGEILGLVGPGPFWALCRTIPAR